MSIREADLSMSINEIQNPPPSFHRNQVSLPLFTDEIEKNEDSLLSKISRNNPVSYNLEILRSTRGGKRREGNLRDTRRIE